MISEELLRDPDVVKEAVDVAWRVMAGLLPLLGPPRQALRADGHALVYLSEAQRAQKAPCGRDSVAPWPPHVVDALVRIEGRGHSSRQAGDDVPTPAFPSFVRAAAKSSCIDSNAAADALSGVRMDMLCPMHQMREDPT